MPLLSVSQILRLVERRLAWYGLEDWRIKDVVCNAEPSVTVIVRGPADGPAARAQLALTIARDGTRSTAKLTPAPRLAPVPQGVAPYIARALTRDAPVPAVGRGELLRSAV